MDCSIIILGAGGHASVIIDILKTQYSASEMVVYDDNAALTGKTQNDVSIVGCISDIPAEKVFTGVIAIGSNRVRKMFAERFLNANWLTVIHPGAIVGSYVNIGPGSVVMAGAIIQPYSRIESHCIVNTAATIDHKCRIHAYAHVAPGCHLAGNEEVGEGAFVGIGSAVIPGVKIGDGSIVGAHSGVIRDISPRTTVFGTPAGIKQS